MGSGRAHAQCTLKWTEASIILLHARTNFTYLRPSYCITERCVCCHVAVGILRFCKVQFRRRKMWNVDDVWHFWNVSVYGYHYTRWAHSRNSRPCHIHHWSGYYAPYRSSDLTLSQTDRRYTGQCGGFIRRAWANFRQFRIAVFGISSTQCYKLQ